MRTIEQICEDLTGKNAMVFMRATDEEFQTFFEENNIEWVRKLLKKYNGNWEAVPSPEDLIESFLGDKKVDLKKLKENFYNPEYNGSLMVFEDGSAFFMTKILDILVQKNVLAYQHSMSQMMETLKIGIKENFTNSR